MFNRSKKQMRQQRLTAILERYNQATTNGVGYAPALAPLFSAQLDLVRNSERPLTDSEFQTVEALISALRLSPFLTGEVLDPWNVPPAPGYPDRYDAVMYGAALAYYGLPQGYNRVFAKSPDAKGLVITTPENAAEAGQACWVQINEPLKGYPLKKAANSDIAIVRNIQMDFEYPAEPYRAHAVGIEFAYWLTQSGYAAEGLPVEDSGAGCHIVLPLTSFYPADFGGPELVNEAIANIVKVYFSSEFERIAARWQLAGKIKLEAFDISRIFSLPGTWRPGGSKPGEALHLQAGYTRRWLAPYTLEYPTRKENELLTELIKAECIDIERRKREEAERPAKVIQFSSKAQGKAKLLEMILQTHCDRIANARPGERHAFALSSARVMGGYISGEGADEGYIERRLMEAAMRFSDADPIERRKVIKDGLRYGKQEPIHFEDRRTA